ncbi:NAD(P)/FAD-dependent oxidoreductase [Streptomyces sp. NBC_00388]|uniref:NAD(P)/FAD-dependent oxidoreductase n=1 Tax=Streptomyces sp. NBC_00388 TaxID=2975735 RepID=UPI002E1D3EAE
MSDPTGPVVVVGASAAGLAAAEGLRRGGYTGPLILVGDETHLPYDRPPLSKQLLSGQWQADRLALRTPEALDALGLDLRLGSAAVALDIHRREVTLADGGRIGYRHLVVATGARARHLPGVDGLSGVHTLRTLEDALALRAALRPGTRLAIVGSGFVGAEAASVARGLGCEVTMITDAAAPLADSLGAELGAMLAQAHRENGVRIEPGVLVRGVLHDDAGRATGIRLADGRTVAADVVLVGIGARPGIDWLKGSGVPVGNGVLCDATLQAGDGVWAAGDVACWTHPVTGEPTRVEHRTHASEAGLAVARNILAGPGGAMPFAPVPYVWSDQYDLKIQIYGATRDAESVRIVEGSTASRKLVALYGRNGRVCGVAGVNMSRAVRSWRNAVVTGEPLDTAGIAPAATTATGSTS